MLRAPLAMLAATVLLAPALLPAGAEELGGNTCDGAVDYDCGHPAGGMTLLIVHCETYTNAGLTGEHLDGHPCHHG